MLPSFLIYLIWIAVALILPVAQSLHALHLRNDKEIRVSKLEVTASIVKKWEFE
jgi:hypothetical protein